MLHEDETAPPLTREFITAAIQKVIDAPMRVCGATEPHIVHPKANGWTICANCLAAVFVEAARCP